MRHTCEQCGLTFRYLEDFEEHQRVGCVVPSNDGPTFSDKDVEEGLDAVEMLSEDALITTCETCGNGVVCQCEIPRIPIHFAEEKQ